MLPETERMLITKLRKITVASKTVTHSTKIRTILSNILEEQTNTDNKVLYKFGLNKLCSHL